MEENRRRPPYKSFMAWMIENDVDRKEIKKLLDISDSSLSQRLNGTGADFTVSEVRTLVQHYGKKIAPYFYF